MAMLKAAVRADPIAAIRAPDNDTLTWAAVQAAPESRAGGRMEEAGVMKLTGFLFLLGYILMVGSASFLQKVAMEDLSPYQLNFFMFLGMLVTAPPALWLAHRTFSLPTETLPLGLSIGLLMGVGSLSYVLAIARLPVGMAASIAASYLVVVVALSAIFLHEPMSLAKVVGIALTIFGVAILSAVA